MIRWSILLDFLFDLLLNLLLFLDYCQLLFSFSLIIWVFLFLLDCLVCWWATLALCFISNFLDLYLGCCLRLIACYYFYFDCLSFIFLWISLGFWWFAIIVMSIIVTVRVIRIALVRGLWIFWVTRFMRLKVCFCINLGILTKSMQVLMRIVKVTYIIESVSVFLNKWL